MKVFAMLIPELIPCRIVEEISSGRVSLAARAQVASSGMCSCRSPRNLKTFNRVEECPRRSTANDCGSDGGS